MTKISFTGDIAFSKHFTGCWADPQLVDERLADFLRESDYVVPNVEGALTDNVMVRGDSATPAHASDPRAADFLLKIKGNIWNLSNNHTLDCAEQGLLDTMALAEKLGCRTLGAGRNLDEAIRPVILPEAGGIGLLATCYAPAFKAGENTPGCVFWLEDERIKAAIAEVKKTCRWCIVVTHGVEEFSDLPVPYAREQYLKYLEWGADIIVGHHPHVPQNYEKVGDKIIFYSLGNFVFDTDYQRIQAHTDIGLLLKLTLTEDSYDWDYRAFRIDREQHRIVPGECPANFRNITAEEYDKLCPLVVHHYWNHVCAARTFLRPDRAGFTHDQWMEIHRDARGDAACARLQKELDRYPQGSWKDADPALLAYMADEK